MSSERRQTAWPSASIREPVARRDGAGDVDRPLGALDGERRLRGDGGGKLADGGLELGVRDEPFGQPDAERLVGVDLAAVKMSSLAFAAPTDAREPLRAAEVGEDAVLELEQADLRPLGEHAHVARERELEPGTERVAAHRGDRRVRRLLEPRVRVLGLHDRVDDGIVVATRGIAIRLERVAVEGVAGEHRRVDAARERAALADDDERPQLGVVDAAPRRSRAARATSRA